MATALANGYYLKALDNYPYCLPEFLESINYALSYDEDHADAHCLMGVFYMEQLQKFADAAYHFDRALSADVNNIRTYYHYIKLSVLTDDLDKAKSLIDFARTLNGINKAAMFHREAMIAEKKNAFQSAIGLIDRAIESEMFTEMISFYKEERSRLVDKIKTKTPVIYHYQGEAQL